MKHLLLFEFYSAINQDLNPTLFTVPNFETDCMALAEAFLDELSTDYVLRKGKPFNPKEGNCAWFSQEFYRWCENNRIPVQLVYFQNEKKDGEDHIAPILNGWVVDFTIKQFTKKPKQEYKVSRVEDYKKYGFDPNKAEILEVFPDWIETIAPLKERKWPKPRR